MDNSLRRKEYVPFFYDIFSNIYHIKVYLNKLKLSAKF